MTQAPRRGGLIIFFSFMVALLLTVLPLPEWVRPFRPSWGTLVLIYWCMAVPQRVGVGIGWLLGITLDAMTCSLLGQHAMGLAIVAFITLRLHRRTRVFPLWQQSIGVLMLLVLERLLSLLVLGAIHRPLPTLMDWAPLLTGTLLWPLMFLFLRKLRRRFKVV